MRSSTPIKKKSRSGSQRRGDQPVARLNRAQLRAMEARKVTTTPDALARRGDVEESVVDVAPGGAAVVSRRRPVVRARALSRAEEYAYIKEDMRRLTIIASILFVVMIVLLIALN